MGTAPAGNRDPSPTLFAFPGPDEINYGENVGYTATLENKQSSTFTHVIYHHKVPTTTSRRRARGRRPGLCELRAGPPHDNWDDFAPNEFYACPERTINAGGSASVLTVWRSPGTPIKGDGVTCDSLQTPPNPAVNDCKLTSSAYWTLKEGTGKPGSAGPDTFPKDLGVGNQKVTGLLGAAPDLKRLAATSSTRAARERRSRRARSCPSGPATVS